jgi:hypothetical protein
MEATRRLFHKLFQQELRNAPQDASGAAARAIQHVINHGRGRRRSRSPPPPALRSNAALPGPGDPMHTRDVFCVPNFASASDDFRLMARLRSEFPNESFGGWHGNRHRALQYQHWQEEYTSAPEVLQREVARLAGAFGIQVVAVRLNLYGPSEYKPLHQDRRGQVTATLSLGATRDIVLRHLPTGFTQSYALQNGTAFVFPSEVNDVFEHGIPRHSESGHIAHTGERLALIVWGPPLPRSPHSSAAGQPSARPASPSQRPTPPTAPPIATHSFRFVGPYTNPFSLRVAPEDIGAFLGPGGSRINAIRSQAAGLGVTIQTTKSGDGWMRVTLRVKRGSELARIRQACQLLFDLAAHHSFRFYTDHSRLS